MLNKYSLEKGHFLVVTEEFVQQKGPVRPQDLVMLHDMVQRPKQRTYAFINGGPSAGASQEHRHFQFMEVPDFSGQPTWPDAIFQKNPKAGVIQSHPTVNIAHFLLPILDSSQEALTKSWERLWAAGKKAAGTEDEEMPYNFLITKEYMMLVPRQNNTWHEDVGIGGSFMVGVIPVEDPNLLDDVKEAGFLQIVRHVCFKA